ncbi:uncharacterized protein LOC127851091 isoform X14 [Dreissena polymorpha]|uniref:uncharacterized protein LOC127851091 isoform X14 n=1 Tax=Dreissena polymorpha TaxID=45954 RepID=UPI0022642278|nr:uncharacterized protein LOC127851091 isoform X14 [Dreissena polymorpha]
MSVLENVGYACLVLTLAATFVSIATPYWLVSAGQFVHGLVHQGLFVHCEKVDCMWTFEHANVLNEIPIWFKATQGLMSAALALGILALIVATLSLCCTCHSCNPHQPICGFLIVASLCIAVAVVVFGVKANQEWKIDFQMDISSSGRFGWSFWTAIGAAGGALLTSVIYCCMDRKSS